MGSNHIESYLLEKIRDNDRLYIKCQEARARYYNYDMDYFYTDDDYGNLINADVNGALNIMIKAVPNAFSKRDIGLVDSPQVLLVA